MTARPHLKKCVERICYTAIQLSWSPWRGERGRHVSDVNDESLHLASVHLCLCMLQGLLVHRSEGLKGLFRSGDRGLRLRIRFQRLGNIADVDVGEKMEYCVIPVFPAVCLRVYERWT